MDEEGKEKEDDNDGSDGKERRGKNNQLKIHDDNQYHYDSNQNNCTLRTIENMERK